MNDEFASGCHAPATAPVGCAAPPELLSSVWTGCILAMPWRTRLQAEKRTNSRHVEERTNEMQIAVKHLMPPVLWLHDLQNSLQRALQASSALHEQQPGQAPTYLRTSRCMYCTQTSQTLMTTWLLCVCVPTGWRCWRATHAPCGRQPTAGSDYACTALKAHHQ